jgi:hypothetical protein
MPSDPSEFFKPEDAIEQWQEKPPSQDTKPDQEHPTGFPPEVPRDPPNQEPEWTPPRPQEVPQPAHQPMPDWSPSSGDIEPPVIDPPENPTEHSATSNQHPAAGHNHA